MNAPPVNSGMITFAASMKTMLTVPSTVRITKNSVEASRKASRRRPFSSSSVNTGTNAALRAESANRLRTRFGT